MKNTSIAAIVFLIFGSPLTQAASAGGGHETEFWYHPKSGQFDVDLQYYSETTKTEIKASGSKLADLEAVAQLNLLGISYGMGQYQSIGIAVPYGSTSGKATTTGGTVTDTKTSGMGDLKLVYLANLSSFYFQLEADAGLSTPYEGSSTQTGDLGSGGTKFTPALGYQMDMGSSAIGLKLSYTAQGDRKTKTRGSPDVDNTITGGSSYSAKPYFEFSYGLGQLAIYGEYSVTADSTKTPSTGSATTDGALKAMTVGALGCINFAQSFALTFDASTTSISDWNYGTGYDKGTATKTAINAGLRFMF